MYVPAVCMHVQYVCLVCTLHCVYMCVHGLSSPFFSFFFCLRLLERITSFKEYEIQHLLKSDTLTLL